MTLRNVPKSYTLEEQRQEINLVAADLDTAVTGVQTFSGDKTFSDNVYLPDGSIIHFGDDNDLKIYFEPSTGGGHIEAPVDLKLQTGRLIVNDAANTAVQLIANQNGSVELYYNAVKKFETSSTGVTILGDSVIGDQDTASSQLKIFSGGTNASPEYFKFTAGGSVATIQLNDNASLGEMQIKARQGIALYGNTSHISVWAKDDGSGSLLYQSAEKLVTTNTGVSITGTASATEFSGPVTGNADTATALETARTIGGVSFDGTANIDLPGVNTAGSQDTSGNAATATALQTARNIAGQSFDGTADITIAATDLSDTDQALATTSNVSFNTVSTDEINSDSFSIKNAAGDQTLASFTPSGGFSLWHSGAIALNSSGSGVTVNDKLTVNTTSGLASTILAQFSNTDASATPLGIGGLTQSDTRVFIQSAADSGGNPHIKFRSGGTDHIVGQLYAGTTNNKLVLGAGSDPTLTTGITIDGLGNVAANNLSFSSQSSGAGLTSEYLDHYEEGTWTPVVKSGANTITFTGGNQAFTYTKIGDTVHVYFAVDGSTSSGTTGGFWTIEGLPFPALSTTGYASVGSIIWDGTGLTGDSWPAVPHVSAGSSSLNVYAKTTAASSYSSVNINQVGAGDSIFFSITYKTDS